MSKTPKDYVERGRVCVCDFCHKDIPLNYGHSLVRDKDEIFCNSICYMENRMNKPEKSTKIMDWIRLGGIALIVLFTLIVVSAEAAGNMPGERIELRGAAVCTNEASASAALMTFQVGGVEALDAFFAQEPACGSAYGIVGITQRSNDLPSPDGTYVLWVLLADAGPQGSVFVFQIKKVEVEGTPS